MQRKLFISAVAVMASCCIASLSLAADKTYKLDNSSVKVSCDSKDISVEPDDHASILIDHGAYIEVKDADQPAIKIPVSEDRMAHFAQQEDSDDFSIKFNMDFDLSSGVDVPFSGKSTFISNGKVIGSCIISGKYMPLSNSYSLKSFGLKARIK